MNTKSNIQKVCNAYRQHHHKEMSPKECVLWVSRYGIDPQAQSADRWYCLSNPVIAARMNAICTRFWTVVDQTLGTDIVNAAMEVRDDFLSWLETNNPTIGLYAIYIWDRRLALPGAHDAVKPWIIGHIEKLDQAAERFMTLI